jgi:hypothetical protein
MHIFEEVYCIKEYKAKMLNNEKLVTNPALHSFISSTIEVTLATLDVNGAEIDAYVCESESPASDCFKAPQSFAVLLPKVLLNQVLPIICCIHNRIRALSIYGLCPSK